MNSLEQPIFLGIESSCDDLGMALVQNGEVLAESLSSSMDEHSKFGGVIPEIASRAHLEALDAVYDDLIKKTQSKFPSFSLRDVAAIGVTANPGLIGCLSVGANFAKGLSFGSDKPLYALNHVHGHILAASLSHPLPKDFLALIVSGGHSSLFIVRNFADQSTQISFEEIGSTLDDAAGEAFDKVGRLLGLKYPAGPEIDRFAQSGEVKINFPLPLTEPKFMKEHRYDFSFSGLKTAAVRELEKLSLSDDLLKSNRLKDEGITLEDFCASFAKSVASVLTLKTMWASDEFNLGTIVIGGGFSANSQLRNCLKSACEDKGKELIVPEIKYCTDNGSMIANLTEKMFQQSFPDSILDFSVRSI